MAHLVAEFPVAMRERADPESLRLITTAQELLCHVDEFTDLIEEFEAWDALARPIDIRRAASEILGGNSWPQAVVGADSDARGLWRAIAEFCKAKGIAFEQPENVRPVRFLEDLGEGYRR